LATNFLRCALKSCLARAHGENEPQKPRRKKTAKDAR